MRVALQGNKATRQRGNEASTRLAGLFCAARRVGLLLLIGLCAASAQAQEEQGPAASQPAAPAVVAAEETRIPVEPSHIRQLSYMLAVLLVAALLILLFVISLYLISRIGRALLRKPVGGRPTPYVDAWSQYRLTDEEIEEATRETDGPGPDAGPPGKSSDE